VEIEQRLDRVVLHRELKKKGKNNFRFIQYLLNLNNNLT
jgi:hypothetical protein